MESRAPDKSNSKQRTINLTLAALVGQIGCLTLVIVLGAVFGGLWLDARFDSKPAFTIGLMLVSIPVSVVVMLLVARSAISKIKNIPTQTTQSEESSSGNNT